MSSTIPNLRPADLAPAVERTPLAILKEQATQLGTRTKNLLEGRVTTRMYKQGEDALFVHTFSIAAPTLDGYTYRLLEVKHGLDLYPLTVGFAPVFVEEDVTSEAAFIEYLRTVFASDQTRHVIGTLLAQVQS